MIDIVHGLKKKVVAEVIEDAGTLGMLTDTGINYAQGHYIGKPMLFPKPGLTADGRERLH